MADVTYAIVFSGKIVEGFQVISVNAHLAKMLKTSPEKIQTPFPGKTSAMKPAADKAEAAKYDKALKKVGADVRVKIIRSDASAAATPIDTSNLSLVPNEGNIVEPAPPTPAPKLDLSNMSILENDGTPLVTPKEAVKVDIDVSSFSVEENDGAPLIEPKADTAPKVEAPDTSKLSVVATRAVFGD